MKLTIKGLKNLDTELAINFISAHELGDIIAYGIATELCDATATVGTRTDKPIKEATAVSDLIRAMLVTTCTYGITWGSKYCVAVTEADLLPETENMEGIDHVYIEMYKEDESVKSNMEDWLEQHFKKLYRTIQKLNIDCAKSNESVAVLTDTDYYTEQLKTCLNVTEEDAKLGADWLRKFVMFQSTAMAVENVGEYVTACNDDTDQGPGRIYCGDLCINSTDLWDEEHRQHGHWYLQICNCQYQTDDLEELELELFLYAITDGRCDDM